MIHVDVLVQRLALMILIRRIKLLVNVSLQQRKRNQDTMGSLPTIRMVLIGQISMRTFVRLEESNLLLTLAKSK